MLLLDIYTDDVNKFLTRSEDTFFDRKSARKPAAEVADLLIGFANASGGVVAIGITDRKFTGIKELSQNKNGDLLQIGMDSCVPTLKVDHAYREVTNTRGEKDQILILEVFPSEDKLYTNKKDEVFLRVGDENRKLTFEQRKQLEYEKNIRSYESAMVEECLLEDLDKDVVKQFRELTNFKGDDIWKLFFARGLAKRDKNQDYHLTVAGVLCFAEYPAAFIPNAKIRFIRYDGIKAEVGTNMNVTKQVTIEGPLPKQIEEAQRLIEAQLKEFTALDEKSGKFVTVPEYPKEAWLEGIVNAVTHRSYNLTGDDIRIIMFDDRLEINSPGKFPSIVNPENIRKIHYSRNPYIARTLTDFGWVREFGEGVDRMYMGMENLFLEDPIFKESLNKVSLTLKNNIIMRNMRQIRSIQLLIDTDWNSLNHYQKQALSVLYRKNQLRTSELAKYLDVSVSKARNTLESLKSKGVLTKVASSTNDPSQYYTFIE